MPSNYFKKILRKILIKMTAAGEVNTSSVQKNMEESEEFFVPSLGLDVAEYIAAENKQGIHHLGRYTWATKVLDGLQGKKLVDIACGSGYGSYMLAEAFSGGINFKMRLEMVCFRDTSRKALVGGIKRLRIVGLYRPVESVGPPLPLL